MPPSMLPRPTPPRSLPPRPWRPAPGWPRARHALAALAPSLLASAALCAPPSPATPPASTPTASTPPASAPPAVAPAAAPTLPAGAQLMWEPAGGLSGLSLAGPAGTACTVQHVAGATAETLTAPATLPLQAGLRYAIACTLPGSPPWRTTLTARPGHQAVLSGPAPAGTPASEAGGLPPPTVARVVAALRATPLSSARLDRLKAELGDARLTAAQAGALLDALVHSSERREALTWLAERIVDPANGVALQGRFAFSQDKAWVRARFAAPQRAE